MKTESPKWWLWPQMLSLDAPLVVMAWLGAFARSHGVHLRWHMFAALGVATWLVYLLDRTADALSGRLAEPLSARHAFCQRHHRWIIFGLVPLLIVFGAWLAFWRLPAGVLPYGIVIGTFACWYLSAHTPGGALRRVFVTVAFASSVWMTLRGPIPSGELRWGIVALLLWAGTSLMSQRDGVVGSWQRMVAKEMLAGLLITLGCIAGVHFWSPGDHALFCTDARLLWAVVTLNLLAIQCSEQTTGRFTGTAQTMPLWWHRQRPQQVLALMLLAVAAVVSFSESSAGSRGVAVCVAVSALLIFMLLQRVRQWPTETFHFAADLSIVLPLPLLWWFTMK